MAALGVARFFDAHSGQERAPAPVWVPKLLRPAMLAGEAVVFVEPWGAGLLAMVERC